MLRVRLPLPAVTRRAMPAVLLVALPLTVGACRGTHGSAARGAAAAALQGEQMNEGKGVQNPDVIDLVGHNPETDTYLLVMVGSPTWQRSPDRLPVLQAKVNTYLSFVLDGQMKQSYPASAGKPVKMELHCQRAPDAELATFVERMNEALKQYQIPFKMRVLSDAEEERHSSRSKLGFSS